MSELQIDFQLLGTQMLPRDISRALEIVPDTELAKGERNPKLGLPVCNIWSVVSRSSSDVLADHWESLRPALERSRSQIKEIARTGEAKITVVVKSSEGRLPSLIIPVAMSAFASAVDAVIDIDHLQT